MKSNGIMETKAYTSKFSVGDKVRYNAMFPKWNGEPEELDGKTGIITKVIFPGDLMYPEWQLANGTGAVKYGVRLDEPDPRTKVRDYLFSESDLVVVA